MPSAKQQISNIKHGRGIKPNVWIPTFGPWIPVLSTPNLKDLFQSLDRHCIGVVHILRNQLRGGGGGLQMITLV